MKKSDAELKPILAIKEKDLQGISAESTIQSTGVAGEIDTGSLFRVMSHIGLKDTELIKLKQQLKELKKERVKEKQGREKTEEKCQGLIQQNAKLIQQVISKISLQGARHLI